jgi:hypothetical protein
MIKSLLLLIGFLSMVIAAKAQTTPITGTIRDSATNRPLERSVVAYVETGKTDTSHYLTDAQGHFSIDQTPTGEFILIISNVGYQTKGRRYPASMAGELGLIQLGEKVKEMSEVIIEAPPIKVMQDTVEYRASAYAVRKDAVAEDLLKKLPGVEVDAQGNVTAQGQAVTKVRVNGKDFFGGDPKMATKNIPADAIDKIQVIDDASDQSKFSGFDDGDRTKIINITIKKDRNQGVFGSATAGVGTESKETDNTQYELFLRAFRFNNSEQMAVLGNANNTNLNTFTQGGASFQGGGGRGGGGGGAASTSPSSNLTSSNPYQTGYNDAKTAGFNYANDFTPHLTLYGSYQFTDTKSTVITQSNTTYPGTDSLPYTNGLTNTTTNQIKHSVLLNFGWGFDKHDSILLKPTYTYSSNQQINNNSTIYQNSLEQNVSGITQLYKGDNYSNNFSGTALWMHKFNKAGRTFSITVTDNPTPTNETDSNYSIQQVYASGITDTIRQLSLFNTNNYTYSGRVSYTEPLSKKSGLEFAYAYSSSENVSGKNVYNLSPKLEETFVDSLSNNFDNTLTTNKFGVTFRHKEKKWNYQIGAALQPTQLNSKSVINDTLRHFDQSELTFVPIGSLAYQFSTTKRLRIFYTGSSIQPTPAQLEPVPDLTNQQSINLGNPSLQPEFDHHIVINYNNFNNVSGRSFFFNLNTTIVNKNISNNIVYKGSVQYITPENVTGYYTTQGYANYSIPFHNRMFILTMASKLAYTNNPSYYDSVRDVARTWVPTETIKFEMDKGDWLEVIAGGSYNLNSTVYGQQIQGLAPNSQTSSWVLAQSSRVDFLKIFSLRYDLTYTTNQGYASSVGAKPITLLNAVLETRMFNQQGVLALAVNDLFNQNASYSQSNNNGVLTQSQTNILQRFFLVSFTYKFAKFKGATAGRGGFQMPGMRGGGGGGVRRDGF